MKRHAKYVALLLVAILVSGVLLTSCAQAEPTTTTATQTTTQVTTQTATQTTTQVTTQTTTQVTTVIPTTPKPTGPYGELRVAVSSLGKSTLFPRLFDVPATYTYGLCLFDPLIGVTPDGKHAPGIAESWEMSSDGIIWTFQIRKGVKFHDGSDLTAADVKFSLESPLGPMAGIEASYEDPAWKKLVDKITMEGKYTVSIHFKEPTAELPKGLPAVNGLYGLTMPKDYVEEYGVDYFLEHPIGSGPWKFVSYDFGNYMEFQAVESHWRAVPYFETLKIMAVPEEATRVAMLKTGMVDLAEITPDSADQVKDAGLRVFSFNAGAGAGTALYPDLNHPEEDPISDLRVRKALSLAINRTELADDLFAGYATANALWYVPPHVDYFDPNVLQPDPYDPEEAKRLLAEAGYANGFDMKLYSMNWTAWMPMLNEAVAGYWRAVGVKTDLVPIEWSAFRPMIMPTHSPALLGNAATYMGSGVVGFYMYIAYHSTMGFHKNHNNTRLDELILQTMTTLDPVERKTLAIEATKEARNHYVHISLLDFDSVWGAGENIGGWTAIQGAPVISLIYESITHAE